MSPNGEKVRWEDSVVTCYNGRNAPATRERSGAGHPAKEDDVPDLIVSDNPGVQRCPGSGEPRTDTTCPVCGDDLAALVAMYPNGATVPVHFR